MNKRLILYCCKKYFRYALLAAFLYGLSVLWFVHASVFEDTWRLYCGNFLFAVTIALLMFYYKPESERTLQLADKIIAGHIITIMGILFSVLLILILHFVFLPMLIGEPSSNSAALINKPAQMKNSVQGLWFLLFINGVIGNLSAGSFISIVFAFVTTEKGKTNQSEM